MVVVIDDKVGETLNTIQEQWESFKSQCIAEGNSDYHIACLKRAFYAGAIAFMAINNEISDETKYSDDAVIQILDGLESELMSHVLEVKIQVQKNG